MSRIFGCQATLSPSYFTRSRHGGMRCLSPTKLSIAHPLSTPVAIAVQPTSTVAVSFSRDPAAYATSCQFVYALDAALWARIYSGAATKTTMTTVGECIRDWTYRVRACNANGCGGYAESGAVSVTVPPFDAPPISGGGTNIAGTYTTACNIVARATSYNLIESANGGALIAVQNNGKGGWSTRGLDDGTYVYQLRRCSGPFAGQIAVTTALILATPKPPTVTTTNSDYKSVAHVNWTAVAGATLYAVLKRDESTGIYEAFYTSTALTRVELTYYSRAIDCSVRAWNDLGCLARSPSDTTILVAGD